MIRVRELAASLGFPEDTAREILDLFFDHAVGQLDLMHKAIAEKNHASLVDAAHSIKGSAANISMVDISSHAAKIEKSPADSSWQDLRKAVLDLESLVSNFEVIE